MTTSGLYLHLPFCRVHCAYCPFAVSTDLRFEQRYTAALRRELEMRKTEAGALSTIYFGGGTPSRTSLEELRSVAATIRSSFDVSSVAETSFEANPEDVSDDSIAAWRDIVGIDRLTVGVQSFHDSELRPLGRVHGREGALAALDSALRAPLRVGIDLILGLPGQTEASWIETLTIALDKGVGHLSVYVLDLEEGTALARRVEGALVTLPDEDLVADLYLRTIELAKTFNLEQYEISNFARAGEESLHNLAYWQRKPYVGVGLGSHSFDGRRRFANSRDIRQYVESLESGKLPQTFEETLSDSEQKREEIFLALRQRDGIRYSRLTEISAEGREWVTRGIEERWLAEEGDRVRFTPEGFLLSNDFIARLF